MKDFDIALHEISDKTGYEYDFLNEIFAESDESYIDRIINISEISLERDW